MRIESKIFVYKKRNLRLLSLLFYIKTEYSYESYWI